ncbi:hypothetical protein CI610_02799 [invertebrate metagenome]|uniref:Reverse transcriptase domain-containing protein n=1 Tax=invertebrate metagenome TaxID=1711999 RepID=A0A2H9T4X8_9ZZZZ
MFSTCNVGLKQGENVSPFLFSIYLNDLEDYLQQNNVSCLQEIDSLCEHTLGVYVRLFVILYADDTVLMSESPEGLQSALDCFQNYCEHWKLTVNTNKTKIVFFEKRKNRRQFHFTIFDEQINREDSYPYLGILFNYNG